MTSSHDLPKHMVGCDLCGQQFQFGPHRYDGRGVSGWGIRICRICDGANHDGLVPQQHPRLISRLAAEGVEMRLNAKGWLPIPS